ncbi:hypothetical protein ACFY4C_30350 [Actinomadura viridis]|uniref:hypothetical protein n=1 Tax=Actinomadura viridis TaxID=58110 RepID=UPI0036AF731E
MAADVFSAMGYRGNLLFCMIAEMLAAERGMSVAQFIAATRDGRDEFWQVDTERICGIPYAVNDLLELCFQALPPPEAVRFAVTAVEAIAVGADLSLVPVRLNLDLLIGDGDGAHGVVQHIDAAWGRRAAADRVVALYQRMLAGDTPSEEEWEAATSDAMVASSMVNDPLLMVSHAAAYAVFAASAMHACVHVSTDWDRMGRWWAIGEGTAAHAAAYTAWAAVHAPDVTFVASSDDVATYGDAPYCYKSHTTFFSGLPEPQKTFAGTEVCQEHFRWRANRLLHHLASAS